MREAQHDNVTAALVTPDRALARRVLAALDRWNLVCNDSGGDSLMDTRAGLFARLIATVVAEQLAPAPLLALLKHPLFRLGRRAGALRRAVPISSWRCCAERARRRVSTDCAEAFDSFRAELAKLQAR